MKNDYPKLEQPRYGRPITDEEFSIIKKQMELAEQNGLLDKIFTGKPPELKHPTKEGLLESIRPDMKLYKETFMRIYGYEISYPGFAEIALSKLEQVGCGKARMYYKQFTGEYEDKRNAGMKEAAEWYVKQLQNKRKDDVGMKNRNDEEVPEWELSTIAQSSSLQKQNEDLKNRLNMLKKLL